MAAVAGIAVFGGLLSIAILTPPDVARAFAIHECTDDQFTRWEGQYATYDRANGGFADWWQDEIDEAAHIWDADGGANFSFPPQQLLLPRLVQATEDLRPPPWLDLN